MNAGPASGLRTLLEAKQRSPKSNSTPKRLARLVALASPTIAFSDGGYRFTKGVVGSFFTLPPLSRKLLHYRTHLKNLATISRIPPRHIRRGNRAGEDQVGADG